MTTLDWPQAIRYASMVKAAEAVQPGADYDAGAKAALREAGFEFCETIYGDDLATDLDAHLGSTVTFGFTALSSGGELLIAIRGTDTIMEWLHDAAFLMVPSPIAGSRGLTEDGFTAVFKSLRIGRPESSPGVKDWVKGCLGNTPVKTITVCGHSLGGALATLLALDVRLNAPFQDVSVYTYASPRTGDHLFAGSYNDTLPQTLRFANRQDLVPKLPPFLPLPYEHVGTEVELVPPPNQVCSTIGCMHHLTTYLWLMGRNLTSNPYPLDADCCVPAGGSEG